MVEEIEVVVEVVEIEMVVAVVEVVVVVEWYKQILSYLLAHLMTAQLVRMMYLVLGLFAVLFELEFAPIGNWG